MAASLHLSIIFPSPKTFPPFSHSIDATQHTILTRFCGQFTLANMSDPWTTAGMSEALPNGTNGTQTNGSSHKEEMTAEKPASEAADVKIPGWVEAHDEAGLQGSSDTVFDGNARVYQWDDEFGDVGPKYEDLELELFGDPKDRDERTGLDFSKYATSV